MTLGLVCCSAAATAKIELPLRVDDDDGCRVWVSLLPAMKAVTCLTPGSVFHGACGPRVSGIVVPCAIVSWPGAWNAKLLLWAAATSLCGHSSWNQANPPLPATMWTLRLVGWHERVGRQRLAAGLLQDLEDLEPGDAEARRRPPRSTS